MSPEVQRVIAILEDLCAQARVSPEDGSVLAGRRVLDTVITHPELKHCDGVRNCVINEILLRLMFPDSLEFKLAVTSDKAVLTRVLVGPPAALINKGAVQMRAFVSLPPAFRTAISLIDEPWLVALRERAAGQEASKMAA